LGLDRAAGGALPERPDRWYVPGVEVTCMLGGGGDGALHAGVDLAASPSAVAFARPNWCNPERRFVLPVPRDA